MDDRETHGAATTGRYALVQGASRGLGLAFVRELLRDDSVVQIVATCRNPQNATALQEIDSERLSIVRLDVEDDASMATAADATAALVSRIDLLLNVAGVLHNGAVMQPERRLDEVSSESLGRAFRVNAAGALLVAHTFQTLLQKSQSAIFAAVSARVGSIEDNRLGGWYAYRASKAALNMMVRTLAIEWSRQRPSIRCVALHPGTVETDLSAPFIAARQNRSNIQSASQSAAHLLSVLNGLPRDATGKFLAWDGQEIPW